jgi:hypothetical protein
MRLESKMEIVWHLLMMAMGVGSMWLGSEPRPMGHPMLIGMGGIVFGYSARMLREAID